MSRLDLGDSEKRHSPTRGENARNAVAVNSSRSSTTSHGHEERDTAAVELGVTAGGDLKRRKDEEGTASIIAAEEREWPDDLMTFDSATDADNPKNWPFARKVAITMLFGITTMCAAFASSVFAPASAYISQQYGVSQEVSVLGIAIFIAGWIPGPVIWAPLSELYGRRLTILLPMFAFICLSAATATAKDVQTIFITRFFAGMMGSSPVTIAGGGIADMFDQRERGSAVVFYALSVTAGPTLGPIIGGAVSQSHLGWRWTEYLTVILSVIDVGAAAAFLPETFAPVILTRKSRVLRLRTRRWALHSRQETMVYTARSFMEGNLLRPLKMIALEPMVTAITLYNSFAYGILYLLFAAVPIVYGGERDWNTLESALLFIAVLIGTVTAACLNILYATRIFMPLVEKHGRLAPEKRLPPMMVGAVAFPIGFFLLGWTAKPSVFWFPSVLGLFFIGMSFLLIFQAGINSLIDAYTQHAASAVAAITFGRSVFAAALPFVAEPLFHSLGVPWACTLLGCISVALAFVPFFLLYLRRKTPHHVAHGAGRP